MKTFKYFINEARLIEGAHIYCPNCGEDHGKASEYGSSKVTHCSTCGLGRLSSGEVLGLEQRIALVKKPNATKDVLERALLDREYLVREQVAKHPNATKKMIETLRQDPEAYVRRAVAERRDTPASYIKFFLKDPDHMPRFSIIGHPGMTKELLEIASKDRNPQVVVEVAKHKLATIVQLGRILNAFPHYDAGGIAATRLSKLDSATNAQLEFISKTHSNYEPGRVSAARLADRAKREIVIK